MRVWLGIRAAVHYRRAAFETGFRAIGYEIMDGITQHPKPGDVLCVWNRYGDRDAAAQAFERAGLPVLIAENGYLGNEFCGERWYAISRNYHNGAGTWPDCGSERWDALGVPLAPFREDGREIVILPQRGIGPMGVAMPMAWTREVVRKLATLTRRPVRVRDHPGTRTDLPTLEADLADAWAVCVWGSGAGIKALAMGVPVFYSFAHWIGGHGARAFELFKYGPLRDDAARLAMFRRLAWAQWRLREIESGEAFDRLLGDAVRAAPRRAG